MTTDVLVFSGAVSGCSCEAFVCCVIRKDMSDIEQPIEAVWSHETEALLASWAEKASCFRWLHGRSEKRYRFRYYCFSIPVIVMSTLAGTANFAMESFVPETHKEGAQAVVGGVNILAGVLGTLQSFLKVAETMEGHRISGIAWSKLGRNITIELSLAPERRAQATDFLKQCRLEYDRLQEQSPSIDDLIIRQFKKRFDNYECSKPAICNGLDRCDIYKRNEAAPIPQELLIPEPEPEPEP